jgi:hypothetical protein
MIGCCLPGKTPTEAALNQEFTVRADEPQKADFVDLSGPFSPRSRIGVFNLYIRTRVFSFHR